MMFYNARLAMLDYFTAVAFLLGAVCAAAHAVRDRTVMLLVVWIVLGILIGSVLTTEPRDAAYRILIILPALIVVGALGLVKIWDHGRRGRRTAGARGPGLRSVAAAGAAFINLNYYFREFPGRSTVHPIVWTSRLAPIALAAISPRSPPARRSTSLATVRILNLHWHFILPIMGQAVVDAQSGADVGAAAPANIPLQLEKMRAT